MDEEKTALPTRMFLSFCVKPLRLSSIVFVMQKKLKLSPLLRVFEQGHHGALQREEPADQSPHVPSTEETL